MGYLEMYKEWTTNPIFDEETKKELYEIANNEKEIYDRFYKTLEFGTAGLRGVIGAGTNRMNYYVIRNATQGLANYIHLQEGAKKGVAIAYDSRRMSREFAQEAALCLVANGIKVYLFESLRPTPELSFAVRALKCIAGINITASHNPPEYNGYKVYWEDGAQIVPPHDIGIMNEIKKITDYSEARTVTLETAEKTGLYQIIGTEIDDMFIAELKKLVLHPETIIEQQKNLKIVYTPLHGTGNLLVRRILKEIGFTQVYVVEEQELPDGDFPTVEYPNPEDKRAFTLGLKLAKKVDADLVLATDPDADRLGCYVKDQNTGDYISLTGNVSGCLLEEYQLSQMEKLHGLPEDGTVVSTIVSTNLAGAIARAYGIRFVEVLTGFKYIGQQIAEFERNKNGTYLFGFEESYGCLLGTHARDKDAVVASMALCEAAAFYKSQGKTLWDAVIDMYNKYGFYLDDAQSYTMKGAEGLQKIQDIMTDIGSNPPTEIGQYKVRAVRDYKKQIRKNMENGNVSEIHLPKSNVLYFELENDAWFCVRPSGTEPKIKIYYGVRGGNIEEAKEMSENIGDALHNIMKKM